MSQHKTPIERLLAALENFEQHASREQKELAVPALRRLSRKLEIQLMELLLQRLLLMQAESTRDRETLRDLSAYSQFPEIVSWASDILHPKPRTPGGLGISL